MSALVATHSDTRRIAVPAPGSAPSGPSPLAPGPPSHAIALPAGPSQANEVRPRGFEPRTCGLRVRCSAVELEAHLSVRQRLPVPVGSRGLPLQGLRLEKLLKPELAPFAADPRLLVAAERRDGIERSAVDVDLPRTDLASYLFGVRLVSAPHPTRKPVDRVIGDLDGLFLGVVRDDRQHGP